MGQASGDQDGGPKPSQEPVIDPETLAGLRELQVEGEPDPVPELLALFLTDAERRVELLRQAGPEMNAPVIGATAHSLKGSCATFGALPMSRLCALLEVEARSPDPATVSNLLDRLEAEFDRVRAALRRELSGA